MTRQHIVRMQGAYYIASGLWPLLSMRSFERVTGPKVDKWLVQTVGLLAATIGTTLIVGAKSAEIDDAVVTLAVLSAFSFAGIDLVHTLRRRISPIYLGDAVGEACLIAALAASR
jgi:hypothetical protein